MIKILKYTVLCFVVFSCKALPEDNYRRLLKTQHFKESACEIIKDENIFTLPMGIEYTNSLKLTDSLVRINDKESFVSNYKLFRCYGTEGKNYRITVYGICNCWGFRKYMLNPSVVLIDNEAKEIKVKTIKEETVLRQDMANAGLPFHTDVEWEFAMTKSCDFTIMLYSNNLLIAGEVVRHEQQKWPFFRSDVIGDFMITIQEK